MWDFIFFTSWVLVMAYCVVANYLYFEKVLPALSRDGLDSSMKFLPSKQLEQVDLFLARFPPDAPRPWFYGPLSHIRIITVVVMLLIAVEMVAGLLSFLAS